MRSNDEVDTRRKRAMWQQMSAIILIAIQQSIWDCMKRKKESEQVTPFVHSDISLYIFNDAKIINIIPQQ